MLLGAYKGVVFFSVKETLTDQLLAFILRQLWSTKKWLAVRQLFFYSVAISRTAWRRSIGYVQKSRGRIDSTASHLYIVTSRTTKVAGFAQNIIWKLILCRITSTHPPLPMIRLWTAKVACLHLFYRIVRNDQNICWKEKRLKFIAATNPQSSITTARIAKVES